MMMVVKRICAVGLGMVGMAMWSSAAFAQDETSEPAHPKCEGRSMSGATTPAPADPYPLMAAGWGPEVGNGLLYSRWAEDWTGMRAAGKAPPLKAMPLGGDASLTLSSEIRLRGLALDNEQLRREDDYEQGLFRGIVGADLRYNAHLRVYAEIGTAQVTGRRSTASSRFQNDASIQQLFVEARTTAGSTLLGAMVGRQEFADGPRQLISLGEGPNLHRTWNGVRLYAHNRRIRVGAFDLRATRFDRGAFEEDIDHAERLQGMNASLVISPGEGPNTYLEPFWIHSEDPDFRAGDTTGLDDRDTYGARLWGRKGGFRFDWTLARQTGDYVDRDIDAWGLFTVQSLEVSEEGWKPRLTMQIDIASGGGAYEDGTLKGFNQLYSSTNYLGQGRFLSLSNLLFVSPGLSASPTPSTKLSIEYGFARRLDENDAVYAGGMRAYSGTQDVDGSEVGGLLRISGAWSANEHLTVLAGFEQLAAGDVLDRAGLPSGGYGYVSAAFRY